MTNRRKSRSEAKEIIESFITKNQFLPHSKLPSEREMCNMWDFNRTTLRFAIKRLVIEGKLYQVKGSGTYIAQPKLVRNLQDLKSFSEVVKDKGHILTSKVLSFEVVDGYKEATEKLELKLEDRVYALTRVRSIDNIPVAIETTFLDYMRFRGLDKYDFAVDSLYSVIESNYCVSISRGQENIGVTYATAGEAELLNVEENAPLFYVSGVVYDDKDKPVEYVKSTIRADKMKLTSVLKHKRG